jgi:hypothetical protein
MRTGISFTVSATDQKRLEIIIKDPKTAQKHVWRSQIVIMSFTGHGTHEIMRATGRAMLESW